MSTGPRGYAGPIRPDRRARGCGGRALDGAWRCYSEVTTRTGVPREEARTPGLFRSRRLAWRRAQRQCTGDIVLWENRAGVQRGGRSRGLVERLGCGTSVGVGRKRVEGIAGGVATASAPQWSRSCGAGWTGAIGTCGAWEQAPPAHGDRDGWRPAGSPTGASGSSRIDRRSTAVDEPAAAIHGWVHPARASAEVSAYAAASRNPAAILERLATRRNGRSMGGTEPRRLEQDIPWTIDWRSRAGRPQVDHRPRPAIPVIQSLQSSRSGSEPQVRPLADFEIGRRSCVAVDLEGGRYDWMNIISELESLWSVAWTNREEIAGRRMRDGHLPAREESGGLVND